ncbi:MAG TPA: endonuclease [Dehalococcoidia bacterium]|nr:endonuclease [Dehalococcoidia bacterium]
MSESTGLLLEAHERLLAHYDIDRWHWREDSTATDICLGAILVQHTSWTNVEKALAKLREAGAASFDAIAALTEEEVAALVRPSGTPTVKARRLKVFAELVLTRGGFEGLFALPTPELRALLLSTYGIGPETADVILLYAARRPVIVHDAYTARLCRRLGIGPAGDGYDAWQSWLDERLPDKLAFRWQNHAAVVVHCKETCRVKPRCEGCPLRDVCRFRAERSEQALAPGLG